MKGTDFSLPIAIGMFEMTFLLCEVPIRGLSAYGLRGNVTSQQQGKAIGAKFLPKTGKKDFVQRFGQT